MREQHFRKPQRFETHLSKNRLDDAEKIVVKAAETNGKQLEGPIFVSEEDKNEDAPKKNACSDFLAMFGDIWNVISGEIHREFLALEKFNPKIYIQGISRNLESDFCACFSSGQSILDLTMVLH